MKIFFRYLLFELIKPLAFCIIATSALRIIADLFGSLDDFIEYQAPLGLIFKFYAAQIPFLLVHVIPVSVLFATLYALLTLSRRSELIALQAGGVDPFTMFSPFLAVAGSLMVLLFVIMGWPATQSQAVRHRILEELKSGKPKEDLQHNVIYIDPVHHRIWHIQTLNAYTKQAQEVEILQQSAHGNDLVKYVAREAEYQDGYWRLRQGKQFTFGPYNALAKEETFNLLSLPEVQTSPTHLAFSQAKPEELTLNQLSEFLRQPTSTHSTRLAPYSTQFHYLFAYPSSLIVLMVFAFSLGTTSDRRAGAAAGVFNSIFLLLGFLFVMNFFLAMGRGNRLPPFLAAWLAPCLFLLFGLALMGSKFGWFWYAERWWIAYQERRKQAGGHCCMLPLDVRNLRLKSLQLLLNKITHQHPLYREQKPKKKEKD